MKRGTGVLLAGCGIASAALLLTAARMTGGAPAPAQTVTAARGPLAQWLILEGRLDSRSVHAVSSRFDGGAVITGLAPEGLRVETNTVLVTLDVSDIDKELPALERDRELARLDAESMTRAKHPLQVLKLRSDVAEFETAAREESALLEDDRELAEEGLVSAYEIRHQERRVAQANDRAAAARLELDLTTNILHRAERERSHARQDAAEQALHRAREQIRSGTLRSTVAGNVVYLPLHVGGEYRTVRVGDTLFKNQPFMAVADLSDPVVRCTLREDELRHLHEGQVALVTPLAHPDLHLEATVEHIGSAARTVAGQPHWQRFFDLALRLEEVDPRLRSGMTMHARILVAHREAAIRLPRTAVWWEGDTPRCNVRDGARILTRTLELGATDDQYVEVVSGIAEGDEVVLP